MPDGGATAAFGFSYQYLATAAYILQLMRDNPEFTPEETTLQVEPSGSTGPDEKGDDIIDFAVLVDGAVRLRVQVKSSRNPDDRPVAPAEARSVFNRLAALDGPGQSVLLTNRSLAPSLAQDCSSPTAMRIGRSVNWTDRTRTHDAGSAGWQIAVAHNMHELENVFEELVREFRRDRIQSQGLVSSRLVGILLRHNIFDAAAGHQGNQISGEQLLSILTMADSEIAHAVGRYDWGNPHSRIPNVKSPVPRLGILDTLAARLEVANREPQVAVLTGHTGIGKSVIASDYCHLNHNRYELVLWLDSRDDGLLQAQIREYTAEITGSNIDPSRDAGNMLATVLGKHRGPWLIVFDGAPGRPEIEPYMPAIGNGSVLVSTTNSTGWWPTAYVQEVGPFDKGQAIQSFASYAGITDADIPSVTDTIASIVQRLGQIPLAVGMAGLYFRNAEGKWTDLVPDYFQKLDALDDYLAIPPGFNRTAFAAIATAVDEIGAGTGSPYTRNAKILMYTASFIAPELIPLNLMIPVTTDPIQIDAANLPKPTLADPHVTRAIVSLLRTQTIAHRVLVNAQADTEALSADCIQIHPLINEILRTKYVATAPPGAIMNAVTVLLGHLTPWLGTMRSKGSFVALEQLRLHAETLLEFLNEQEPLSAFSAQQRRVYLVMKAGVMAEVACCYANTSRMQKSVTILHRLVIHYLENFPGEEWAQSLAAKHGADMLVDMSRASVAPLPMFQVAGRVLGMLRKLEQSNSENIRRSVYTIAHQCVPAVTSEAQYRDHPMVSQLATGISKIADRDPDKSSNPEWLMRQINARVKEDDYEGALASIPRLRALTPGLNDRVTLDSLEIVAELHCGRLDTAFESIDALLEVDIVENHMILELRGGLVKIAQALYRGGEHYGNDARFASYLDRVKNRLAAVERSIQAVQPRNSDSL